MSLADYQLPVEAMANAGLWRPQLNAILAAIKTIIKVGGTGVGSAAKWTTARTLSFTGDVTGSGSVDGSASVATALTLASVVSASTQTKITYDAKGRVTAGAQAGASDLSNGVTGSGAVVLAAAPTISGAVNFTGTPKLAGDTTGIGTVLGLGANSPAITLTGPYTWLKFTSSDGSTVYVPAYK